MNETQDRIAFLQKFKGVPSYDRELEQLLASTSEVDGVAVAEFTEALEDQAEIDADQSEEIEDKADAIKGRSVKIYYVGGELGDDENDGRRSGEPCATFAGLMDKMELSQPNRIIVLGRVEVHDYYTTHNGSVNIDFRGDNENSEIEFMGEGGFNFGGDAWLRFFDMPITNNGTSTRACLSVSGGGSIRFSGCDLDHTEAAQGPLMSVTPHTHVRRNSTVTSDRAANNLLFEIGEEAFNERLVRQ